MKQDNGGAEPLWTRDFTIITLGTVVSMFGNAVSSFALGLLVLEYTNSILLYSFYLIAYNIPRAVLPLFAGPYLDRFSRKRVIYSLDFFSAGLFFLLFILLKSGFFHYGFFLFVSAMIGAVESVYAVAYDSFFPTLIHKGNFTRAYSVSSLINPLATVIMVPVAGLCYRTIGLSALFAFNAATFLVAAVMETRIQCSETHCGRDPDARFGAGRLLSDLREGIRYLKAEPGLCAVTVYFVLTLFCTEGLMTTLTLPYFESLGTDGVTQYAMAMSATTAGRIVAGVVQYRYRYPPGRKFAIAMFVYVTISVLNGSYLYLPFGWMLAACFLIGMLGVTSYNIRLSSMQNYVPNLMRGRFNGTFQMLNITGSIMGQLAAGALAVKLPVRPIISAGMVLNITGALAIVLRNRKEVSKIYNVEI